MKLVVLTALAAIATAASASPLQTRQSCPEAARFGIPQISPSILKPGENFTVTGTFACSAEKGIHPIFIEYFIQVPFDNNGHEPSIYLARHDFPQVPEGQVPVDTLTTSLPTYGGYFANAGYNIAMQVTYPVDNGDGTQTLLQGGVYQPFTIDLS